MIKLILTSKHHTNSDEFPEFHATEVQQVAECRQAAAFWPSRDRPCSKGAAGKLQRWP